MKETAGEFKHNPLRHIPTPSYPKTTDKNPTKGSSKQANGEFEILDSSSPLSTQGDLGKNYPKPLTSVPQGLGIPRNGFSQTQV